ncbi:MAG: cbb3-type cytochrome c oxidase subunit I, partial [Actinomycetota bacterium]|nr:cbb3-type cytochrome c oxidase subunit I [Actinomycetota bacterium]
MTLLEERPGVGTGAGAPSRPALAAPADNWFDTGDHKRLGLMFIASSLLFVAVSGVVGLFAGAKQASPGLNVAAGRFARLYGLHTQSAVLLFLTALWIGLATYVVPLQVGAGRVALPRALATGFWTYFFGGICFLVSYLVGQVNGLGLTQSHPIAPIPGGATAATTLWVVGLGLVAVGFLLASASLLVTVAGLRTDGMTFLRVPAFSWATMVASAVTMVATPVFLAGLLLLGFDQYFGGKLFAPTTPGSLAIWQHTLWLYGRPDVFLLTLLALGAASDIVATHAGRPLLNHQVALVLMAMLAAVSLGTWASSTSVVGAVIVPTYNVLTALVFIPLGLSILLWLGTAAMAMRGSPGAGHPTFHVSLLFVVGAIGLWVSGAANAIGAAAHHVPGFGGNSAWIAGNVHTVVVGPPTLIAFGALYHWGPKMWGRRLSTGLGGLAFLCLFGGFAASGLASYFLGYNGAPLAQIDAASSYQKALYLVAEIGGGLIVLGVVVVVADIVLSVVLARGAAAGDDPYDGLTLEWATTSPPPPGGFDSLPEVRSEAPLYY